MSNEQDALELARRVRPAMTKLYVSYFRTAEHSELTGPQPVSYTHLTLPTILLV